MEGEDGEGQSARWCRIASKKKRILLGEREGESTVEKNGSKSEPSEANILGNPIEKKSGPKMI